jgi:hypothetical protein
MDNTIASVAPPRRFQFGWVGDVYFHPRQLFTRIAAANSGLWQTPMLLLSLSAVLLVLAGGWIKQSTGSTAIEIPPQFQYYTPEQQAQFQQAMAATQGPVFLYVFPGLVAIFRVWLGWLLVGGLIHLISTMLGGRGSTGTTMNVVAWSGMPFFLRDLVRLVALLVTHNAVRSPGMAGFVPASEAQLGIFLTALLGAVDIYLIWAILLISLGVRISTSITTVKAVLGAIITIMLVLSLQAGLSYLTSRLSGLTVIRPFF